MKRSVIGWSSVLLLGAFGCGSDGDGGGGGGPAAPVVDLRVDNNRDGQIDWGDPTEDENEDVWSVTNGAVFLPNIDDDSERCPRGDQGIQGISDVALKACHDGANEEIDGPDDLADLARIHVVPWPGAGAGATGRVSVNPEAAPFVRLFRNGADGWKVLDVGQLSEDTAPTYAAFLSAEEVRTGVELAIEGKDVLRDAEAWNGLVNVELQIDPGGGAAPKTDLVQMRIAPLLLSHHLQKAERIYVSATGGLDSAAFRQDLQTAIGLAGVPEALSEHYVGDQWIQDWMETAYVTMPAPGGQHKIDVFMRSVNIQSKNAESPLRPAGRQVYAQLHGKDSAGFTPDYDINSPGQMDSLDSYGNTETIPPYEHNGQSYPVGRVFRGSVPGFYVDPAMEKMLEAQQVQPRLYVDTSWLLVGHVDETVTFLKMNNARGWGMGVNDPRLAKTMLEQFVSQGHGGVTMFKGKSWIDFQAQKYVPAEISIDGVLADTEVMAESNASAVEVDHQMDIIKAEVGITDQDIIPMPFLHIRASGYSLAYQPGTVNGIYLSDTDFGVPTPHGPVINGADPFVTQLNEQFQPHGIKIHLIENWDLYHRLSGEVHCGTNTKRALPTGAAWWESGR